MNDDPERQNLGRHVQERRLRLGLSVRAAADKAGVDRSTWSNLEAGARKTAVWRFAGIERALEWEPGSISAILDGGEPTPKQEIRDLEAELIAIRDNPARSRHLRAMAQSQLDQIAAIRAAAAAEAQQQRRAS